MRWPYLFLRALELQEIRSEEEGAWESVAQRIIFGEGIPSDQFVELPDAGSPPPAPKIDPDVLRENRTVYYGRVRTANDCELLTQSSPHGYAVSTSLPLTLQWVDPQGGVIQVPESEAALLPMTHSVTIVDSFPLRALFTFENWWGEEWGDGGLGHLPYEYFDRYAFDAWTVKMSLVYGEWKSRQIGKHRYSTWRTANDLSQPVYGFQITDDRNEERYAWAFAVERDGAIEVEELFVRHPYRSQGHGRWLAEQIAVLSRKAGKPLRVWVPFADCRQESPKTYDALVSLARRLGVQFHKSPVRWAAYYATNEMPRGSDAPVEPESIPQRPRGPLPTLKAMAQAAATAVVVATSDVAPIPPDPPQPGLATATSVPTRPTVVVGTSEWDQLTADRLRLIDKKYREGLTAAELVLFERLQRLSSEALEHAYPRPTLTPEERALVKKALGGDEEVVP
jgi:GNAT superfamily N-acetyltransferase